MAGRLMPHLEEPPGVRVLVPLILGFFCMKMVGHSLIESIFVGAAMVATSVGITPRVLADAGMLSSHVARIVLAAAVLDDILGMIAPAVVSSLSSGRINYVSFAVVSVEAVVFSLLIVFFGSRVVGRFHPNVAKLRSQNAGFVLSIILYLGLSLASVYIGMAAIIEAFLVGLALADLSESCRLRENAHPLMEFLTPFFFVLLGAQVNLKITAQSSVLFTASVICVLAVPSKLIGCGLGSLRLGWKDSLRIGIGMVPRGEVGLIVASVGLGLRTISDAIYSVVLLMTIFTTLFVPPVLRLTLQQSERRAG